MSRSESRFGALTFSAVVFSVGLWSTGSIAHASPFLNINFDSQNNGDPINTTSPAAPSPETDAYATGGFPDTGPYTGTNTVVSPAGLSKANLMSTNQGGIGSNYMDTQFLVTGNQIQLDFDIRMVAQSATGYPQTGATTPNGQSFAINAFALDSNRVFRFAATPNNSTTTGEFGMRNNTDGDLIPIGTYTVGSDYHVSILANYVTNTVDVTVSGVGSLTGLPFVSPEPVNGGMEEFFFFQNGIEGQSNQLALDNIVGAVVPEPSSVVLAALGLLGIAVSGWRRRKG